MADNTYKRIVVTGATGFLGHHLVPVLQQHFADSEVIGLGRADYDLIQPGQAEALIRDTGPDAIVHLAAKVGGLFANKSFPGDFFYENIMINTQMLHAAFSAGVGKFLTFIGGCSYPTTAPSPIPEDQIWQGYPDEGAAPYSLAKRMALVQSRAYRDQHQFNSVVLIPGNVYGEHDNFHAEHSHVIPGMIRRFVEAREARLKSIACYGTGRPTRDFVYAGDVAQCLPWFLLHYDRSEPINISTGTRISIKELAETIKAITGFQGEIRWDTSKADGHMDKIFSVERLHGLGMSCDTPLPTGIQRTVDWFVRERKAGTVRL